MHNRKARLKYLAVAFSLSGMVAAGMPVSALAGQTRTHTQVQEKKNQNGSGRVVNIAKVADQTGKTVGETASDEKAAVLSADLSSGTEADAGNSTASEKLQVTAGSFAGSQNFQVTAGNFYDSNDVQSAAMTRQERKIWKNWVVALKKTGVFNSEKKGKKIGTLEKGSGALILDEAKDAYQVKAGRQIGWIKKSDQLLRGQEAFDWVRLRGAVKAQLVESGTRLYEKPDEKSASTVSLQKLTALVVNPGSIDLLTPDLSDYTTSAAWLELNVQGKTCYVKSADVVTGYDISAITPVKTEPEKTGDTQNASGKETTEKKAGENREEVFSISLNGKCAADVYTYMGWRCITSKGSMQYKLLSQFESYDDNGFGKIGDRYVIATTTTFGDIGDLVDFTLANGEVIHAIIGDHKNMSDPGCNMWGHQKGHCVVEFVVNKASWYGTAKTPTGFHSEWASRGVKATNYGNIWDDSHTDYAAKARKALAHIRALEANGGDKPTPTEEELKAKKEAEAKKKAKEKAEKEKAEREKKKKAEKEKKEKEKKAKAEKLKKAKAAKLKKEKAEKLKKERAEKVKKAREAQQEKEKEEKLKQQKEEAEKKAEEQKKKEKEEKLKQQKEEAEKKAEEQKKKEEEEQKRLEEEKQKENNSGTSENGGESSATEESGGDSSAPAE